MSKKNQKDKKKVVTKTKTKSRQWKDNLISEIRDNVEKPQPTECDIPMHVYVLNFCNQRNDLVKNIRHLVKPGRLFFGKNKLIQRALGVSPETEIGDNLSQIANMLSGERGILITRMEPNALTQILQNAVMDQFARCGQKASFDVKLSAGMEALAEFPHSMFEKLKDLSLPVMLRDGKIELLGDYKVCEEHESLTPASAQMLKFLGVKMSRFSVSVEAFWCNREVQICQTSSNES